MAQIRIIPVLIVVAILSFSVRLADIVFESRALFGVSAFAKEDAQDNHAPEEKAHGGDGGDEQAHESGHSEEVSNKSNEAHDTPMEPDNASPEWRDPGDQDPRYEVIREDLLDDLSERRKSLDERESKLRAQEALLKVTEQELHRKYKEMEQLRVEIENLLGRQSEEEKARIASLVKVYEGMKPKDAARIFDTLDLDILVSVMSKMSERKMSPVLAAMNPERARTVTIMLAEQKQLPSLP